MTATLALTPGREATSATSQGMRDIAPIVIGLVPFALAIGASAAELGLRLDVSIGGAAALLAGSAQIAVLNSIGAGSAAILTVATAVMINLRFAVYGIGFGRWFADEPLRRRLWMSIALVDQNYLMCEQAFADNHCPEWRRRYYTTITAALVVAFLGGQIIGYGFAATLPAGIGLEMAGPLAFAAMLGSASRAAPQRTSAIVGGLVAVAAAAIGVTVAAPIALIAGAAAGTIREDVA